MLTNQNKSILHSYISYTKEECYINDDYVDISMIYFVSAQDKLYDSDWYAFTLNLIDENNKEVLFEPRINLTLSGEQLENFIENGQIANYKIISDFIESRDQK